MFHDRIGPIARAWYKWKALRLPWRKRLLVGFDLEGNTFWEFRTSSSSERWRRIVHYPRSTPYSSIKVSPQWHQWLRHARHDPPGMDEQRADVARQAAMKRLAAAADARWEAKPRLAGPDPSAAQEGAVGRDGASRHLEAGDGRADGDGSWKTSRPHTPGENWQPTAWNPTAGKKGTT